MLQHRHVWNDGTFSAWHDADRKHTGEKDGVKYEDDTVFETRESGAIKPRANGKAAKAAKLAYDLEVYGVVTPEAAKAAFDAALYAEAVTPSVVKEAEEIVVKAGNLPRALKA